MHQNSYLSDQVEKYLKEKVEPLKNTSTSLRVENLDDEDKD